MKLLNAFSISMLGAIGEQQMRPVSFQRITLEAAKGFLSASLESRVGHEDSAQNLSQLLGMTVPMNRENTLLDGNAIVAQYIGPRLPQGTKTLPEGAEIQWFLLEVGPLHVRRLPPWEDPTTGPDDLPGWVEAE